MKAWDRLNRQIVACDAARDCGRTANKSLLKSDERLPIGIIGAGRCRILAMRQLHCSSSVCARRLTGNRTGRMFTGDRSGDWLTSFAQGRLC